MMLVAFAPAVAPAVPMPTLTVSGLPSVQHPIADVSVRWNTGSGVPGDVMLLAPGARTPIPAGYGNSGMLVNPNVEYQRRYVYLLYTIGLHHRLLAETGVFRGAAITRVVSVSWTPPRTGSAIDRLLQVLPFVVGAMLLALTVLYVRSLRHASAHS
jgi:hypothetical protein